MTASDADPVKMAQDLSSSLEELAGLLAPMMGKPRPGDDRATFSGSLINPDQLSVADTLSIIAIISRSTHLLAQSCLQTAGHSTTDHPSNEALESLVDFTQKLKRHPALAGRLPEFQDPAATEVAASIISNELELPKKRKGASSESADQKRSKKSGDSAE
ncbi:hypothetical protein H696_05126 [Fonticula alba]|uniref:Uncharacterized protein n=1 Tax=Fonticula alba TaxID=691883 RepID=A0A058Z3U4_FONAL|nr:hypothetical protein H696_05126 [Fonticula alba]KCV68197.1 hypothetical protein H696_05126 [Fonticula alba]|eukprot:XP_009497251.1 hypothetical protein H696_05126 [Fonticula alba]